MEREVVITVAPTGGFQGKEANPALPTQPAEIAEDVYNAWREGASVVHIHGRDKDGMPTVDWKVYNEIISRIRDKGCDIITQVSTAGGFGLTGVAPDIRLECATKAGAEMASLDLGPLVVRWKGQEAVDVNARSTVTYMAKVLLENNIKPEIELFSNTMVGDLYYLIDNGLLGKPYLINLVMGMDRHAQGVISFSPKNMLMLLELLPQDSIFNVMGIGENQLSATTMSVLLGGNVRVGFEDNIYIERGVLAPSNAQLVAKTAGIIKALGFKVATSAEARKLFEISRAGSP